MTCENAQQNIILAQYNELPDELQFPLEQHVSGCEDCRREWKALIALNEELALVPVVEPSPNMLAASRMRLDEALDMMPARSMTQQFWGNAWRWMGFMQGAPALTVLLLGVGFLGGNFIERYQVAHMAVAKPPVVLMDGTRGAIASVAGISPLPNSNLVSVRYNRLVPETAEGTLDDPQIKSLLMLGTTLAANEAVHEQSVAWLANACAAPGLHCGVQASTGSSDVSPEKVRGALLAEFLHDESPEVRLNALHGLQPYVAEDRKVRDALLTSLAHDKSADVRMQVVSMLSPVRADSSVRQVLHTVSTQDANPAIRNASYVAWSGASDVQ